MRTRLSTKLAECFSKNLAAEANIASAAREISQFRFEMTRVWRNAASTGECFDSVGRRTWAVREV